MRTEVAAYSHVIPATLVQNMSHCYCCVNSVMLQKDVYVLFLALCGLIKLGEKNAFLVKRVGEVRSSNII